jgi:outer membrane protein TolC
MASQQAIAARVQAENRYAQGLTDLVTMLTSQRNAFEAESRLLAVRRQRLDNRVNLHLALGGGFTPEIPLTPQAQAKAE